ncbi:MAG: hypothetical protein AAF483_01060 [Planctomycetota bacterium]
MTSPATQRIRLDSIAYARSGDKGCNANIGLIAHSSEGYELLCDLATEHRVLQHFAHTPVKRVQRFELPNLWALNFILFGVLGKGGSQSLAIDAQGKALGQVLLMMEFELTPEQIASALPPVRG